MTSSSSPVLIALRTERLKAIGLDGFSKGWVAVVLDGDTQSISFQATVADVLRTSFDRAGIDIPIGMTDDGDDGH